MSTYLESKIQIFINIIESLLIDKNISLYIKMRTIYYDYNNLNSQEGFRNNSSAFMIESNVTMDYYDNIERFNISEPLYWAIFNLEIIDKFKKLPNDGILDAYEEGTILFPGLKDAIKIIQKSIEILVPDKYDWYCGKQTQPEEIEYRIIVRSNLLKNEMNEFCKFLRKAKSKKLSVELWL